MSRVLLYLFRKFNMAQTTSATLAGYRELAENVKILNLDCQSMQEGRIVRLEIFACDF